MRFSNESSASSRAPVISNRVTRRCSSPLSILDRFSMVCTSRDSRLVSLETMVRYFFSCSGGMVPSRIPSIKPEIVVIGVFSSWLTLAIKLRLAHSLSAREVAMALNATASSLISSSPLSSTRTEKSPSPKLWAASAIFRSGCTMRKEKPHAAKKARINAAIDAHKNMRRISTR